MAKAMRYFVGTVERETAKAVLVRFIYHVDSLTLEEHTATAWLPKSQIEEYRVWNDCTVWRVPLWLCNKNGLPTMPKRVVDEVDRMSAA